jgi:hypothetical protein
MVKDYDPATTLKRTINLLLQHARTLDLKSTAPSITQEAAAARCGHLLGVAYQLHDILVTIPLGSMYDLRRNYIFPNSIRQRRPSSLRGRW